MRQLIICIGLLSLHMGLAQQQNNTSGKIGINTDAPKATLEVQTSPSNTNATTNEGIIAPKLSKTRIAQIANPVEGTLVYATNEAGSPLAAYTGNNAKVAKITEKGYYFYNGTEWVKTHYTGSASVALEGNSFQREALTGDVSAEKNSNTLTIAPNAVTSDKIANGTIKAEDLSSMGARIYDGLSWNGTQWSGKPFVETSISPWLSLDGEGEWILPDGNLILAKNKNPVYYGLFYVYQIFDEIPKTSVTVDRMLLGTSDKYYPLEILGKAYGVAGIWGGSICWNGCVISFDGKIWPTDKLTSHYFTVGRIGGRYVLCVINAVWHRRIR